MVNMALLDDLRPGATVISSDGKKVGRLHAVVIDSRDDEVTHVVVNTGPFFPEPAFGVPKLVSLPIEEMADARGKKVILKCTKKKLSLAPVYAEWSFTQPMAPGTWRMEAMVGAWRIPVPTEIIHKRQFEREIMRGAYVWRVEPNTEIGDVDRVLVDERTGRVEGLVIRRGHLFGREVILPIVKVVDFVGDVVHVDITDEELQALEEFRPPSD